MIRDCEKGHTSLDAANWRCPWCELEREQMRLVACEAVARADTPESAAATRQMHDDYRSNSLTAVIDRVDECIRLRAELAERARDEVQQTERLALVSADRDALRNALRDARRIVHAYGDIYSRRDAVEVLNRIDAAIYAARKP